MKLLQIAMLLIFANVAHGSERDMSHLCKKMQGCMLKELQSQQMPEGMMQMMKPSIDNMCVNMNNRFKQSPNQIEKDINACLKAMESASCDILMNNPEQLKECEYLNKQY